MLNQIAKSNTLHLILNYRPLGLVRATAKALGPDGMAVETGCILLPERAEVEVTFSYRRDGRNNVSRIPARVTRSSPGETRLEFDSEGRSTIQSLIEQSRTPAFPQTPAWGNPIPVTA